MHQYLFWYIDVNFTNCFFEFSNYFQVLLILEEILDTLQNLI